MQLRRMSSYLGQCLYLTHSTHTNTGYITLKFRVRMSVRFPLHDVLSNLARVGPVQDYELQNILFSIHQQLGGFRQNKVVACLGRLPAQGSLIYFCSNCTSAVIPNFISTRALASISLLFPFIQCNTKSFVLCSRSRKSGRILYSLQ